MDERGKQEQAIDDAATFWCDTEALDGWKQGEKWIQENE